MDITTIVGFISGIGFLVFAILLGGSITSYINMPSVMITVGGTFAATLIHFPLTEILRITKAAIKALKSPRFDPSLPIPIMIRYSEKSRQQGLLSLEDEVEQLDDEFLKTGMRLVIDGTDPDSVRDIMETELDYLEQRHKRGQDLFLTMAKYAPAFGMIGTLVGLINMLQTMDDPSSIGPSMAVSLITTFYGSIMANRIFMPIAGKLKVRSGDETLMRRIVLEGILMIQAQVNPRFIGKKLISYLPPKAREAALQNDISKREEVMTNEQVPTTA